MRRAAPGYRGSMAEVVQTITVFDGLNFHTNLPDVGLTMRLTLRWPDSNSRNWKLLFDEGAGKDRVIIEKGEHAFYRLGYWRGDKEASILLHGETADELAKRLINENIFTEDEARELAKKIVNNPSELKSSRHAPY